MADTVAAVAPAAAPAQTTPKKAKSGSGGKKPRAKPAHPRTSEMVSSAIKSLKERGGSSLQAIKKYIAVNYKVDPEKFAPFIKKYLKSAVASGELVQTKGKGASGSFKLASAAKPEKAAASAPARGGKSFGAKEKKQSAGAKAKRAAPKSPKQKVAAAKKGVEKKKTAAAAKPKKSPSKAKKITKVPTKKPKAPKPKKVGKAPKKASPKKK